MANFPQKRRVNVAAPSNRLHDLSHAHITTTDFGRMKPIECRYCVPGDEINMNINSETRVLSNMPSPTYGRFDLKYRAFFVPIHNIWSPFYDWLKNQNTVRGGNLAVVNKPPYCFNSDFYTLFDNSTYGLSEVVNVDRTHYNEYDFMSYNSQTELQVTKRFTNKGRLCYDFLTSMGLNINLYTGSQTQDIINILPFVAFWKVYFDWIVPSRFIFNHADYIQKFIDKYSNMADPHVSVDDLYTFLIKEPLCYFEDDLFNNLTEYPFQGSEEYQFHNIIQNPVGSNTNAVVESSESPNPLFNGSFAFIQDDKSFNMFTLQTLGKLQDMLNRNLLAGTKVQDWLLTEFGMKPSNDALHLSTYLGSRSNVLNINDIMSTADTLSADGQTGVGLGSYGGFIKEGYGFDFHYKSNEHGYLIVTYELVPRSSYYQGLKPEFDMMNQFDFFQPEFDNQQGAPIPFKYLFNNINYPDMGNYTDFNKNFGFTLQYAPLKFATDTVSGDFRTRFGFAMRSWFLTRDMSKIMNPNVGDVDMIDEEFCLVKSKYQDWNYIFADTNDNLDHFLTFFYFNMPCRRPMKSIVEGFEPTYKNTDKEVTVDFSGSVK